jgi:hypothetical protein
VPARLPGTPARQRARQIFHVSPVSWTGRRGRPESASGGLLAILPALSASGSEKFLFVTLKQSIGTRLRSHINSVHTDRVWKPRRFQQKRSLSGRKNTTGDVHDFCSNRHAAGCQLRAGSGANCERTGTLGHRSGPAEWHDRRILQLHAQSSGFADNSLPNFDYKANAFSLNMAEFSLDMPPNP